ncbi:MAG TPA: hypothetical protein VJJ83_04955, partial [Candidatus Babeliales bacterium]|nr:hypothetical protein [Candidatus Babeliales bacterium]
MSQLISTQLACYGMITYLIATGHALATEPNCTDLNNTVMPAASERATPTISTADAQKIGLLIWQNEASQRVDLLTFWNPNESFPSLGIGHFIWHPAGTTIPYTEQFPALCRYLQSQGVALPDWLVAALPTGAPWANRAAF